MPSHCAHVNWYQVLERLSCQLVILVRALRNGAVCFFGTGNGVPKEGQSLAAVVAHGHPGRGHEHHHAVQCKVPRVRAQPLNRVPLRQRRHLGPKPQAQPPQNEPAHQQPEGLVVHHVVRLGLLVLGVLSRQHRSDGGEEPGGHHPVHPRHAPAVRSHLLRKRFGNLGGGVHSSFRSLRGCLSRHYAHGSLGHQWPCCKHRLHDWSCSSNAHLHLGFCWGLCLARFKNT
mmetsp:Transcript_22011/g.42015  ORF Transcript_22011/g.42015 Transcript_22011/m.42015 type:complete len:229 (+) Transcript_22011:291-977(+)